MIIKRIKNIDNFRNLSGKELSFNDKVNFIVGENSSGKSNLIKLLQKSILKGVFSEIDFFDINSSITIDLQFELMDSEIGYFESLFDIDGEKLITIRCYQEDADSRIVYTHLESGNPILARKIKQLNFLLYSSLRIPQKEISFQKSIGSGKVLNFLLDKVMSDLEESDKSIVDVKQLDIIVDALNDKLRKVGHLSLEDLSAFYEVDNKSIINRLLEIGNTQGHDLSRQGEGIQFSFSIYLNILEYILKLKNTRSENSFDNSLIEDEDGKKYFHLLIALDEPEIHQHPYRQRSLIKGLTKILSNKNSEFNELLKELFDIDGFTSQLFVVTHSPNIILDDYKTIVRFAKREGQFNCYSGSDMGFEADVHKHLLRSFIYFKEAFFAKKVILVEGDSEFGAIKIFSKDMDIDFDDLGIGVIKLDGAESVLKYQKLLTGFGIETHAILDHDKEDSYSDNDWIYFTNKKDFEEEIINCYDFDTYVEYLYEVNKHSFLITYLKELIEDFDASRFVSNPMSYKIAKETKDEVFDRIKENEINEAGRNKSVLNGMLLAKYSKYIPSCYYQLIQDVAGVENE